MVGRVWASFHSRPNPAHHKMPVSSNVRRHKFTLRRTPVSNFCIETKSNYDAPAFERVLLNAGYVERVGATTSTLQIREYTKRHGSNDPNSFSGTPTVTFEIRES